MLRPRPVVFLSYAREDSDAVNELRASLEREGFQTWMDQQDIRAGDWQLEIDRALRKAHFAVCCVSEHSLQPGKVLQYELDTAVDIQRRRLEGDVFLIPVRLEPCALPASLAPYQAVDWFAENGGRKLLEALRSKTLPRIVLPRILWAALIFFGLAVLVNFWYLTTQPAATAFRAARSGAWFRAAAGAPMLGLTFWKLVPVEASHTMTSRDWVYDAPNTEPVAYTALRWNPKLGFQLMDKVRLSVEASQPGYVYVIGQPRYSGGREGQPRLLFPAESLQRTGRVERGTIIDVPQLTDRPEYFTIRSSQPDFQGDEIVVVWSREEKQMRAEDLGRLVREANASPADSDKETSVRTAAESEAHRNPDTVRLTPADRAPQLVFRAADTGAEMMAVRVFTSVARR